MKNHKIIKYYLSSLEFLISKDIINHSILFIKLIWKINDDVIVNNNNINCKTYLFLIYDTITNIIIIIDIKIF